MNAAFVASLPPESGFTWKFGGPLSSLPTETAWAILGVTAAMGVVWIAVSYWHTLLWLSWRRRLLLCGLRTALLLGVLAALSGPTWIDREYVRRTARPLAVLVDRSQSMTKPDYRGQQRIDDALRRWRGLAGIAERRHGAVKAFEFASGVRERTNGAATDLATGETRLFNAIDDVLGRAPAGGWAGVVTLTDGIETAVADASAASAATARKALASGTPLYFVAGRNLGERKEEKPFVTWRDLVVPTQTPPRSTFSVELTIESYQPSPRSVPVRIRVGSRWRDAEPLFLNAGRRAVLWKTDVLASEAGPLELELRAGEGDDALVARAVVNVQDRHGTKRILLAQFTPDWGLRFLADSLSRDPQFEIASRVAMRPREGVDFPRNAAGLVDWDIVVLTGLSATSLNREQQAALGAWVRNGGVLLLVAPEARSGGFAGSELERILPVTFAPAPVRQDEQPEKPRKSGTFAATRGGATPHGQHAMQGPASPRRMIEILPSDYRDAIAQVAAPELAELTWAPIARHIFAGGTIPFPIISSYVDALSAKPGAEVLARHPTADGADGRKAILLASQRYGAGATAILATDALWRWKLLKPSGDHDYDLFWGQILAWLGRHQPGAMKFDHGPLYAEPGRPVQLRVAGVENDAVFARAMTEGVPGQVLKPGPGAEKGTAIFEWTPGAPGFWHVEARTTRGREAHHWVTVRPVTQEKAEEVTAELSGRPTDEAVLASLAQATGGALLDTLAPAAWTTGEKEHTEVVAIHEVALWHQWQFLAALVLLYAADLVLRRFSRLL
jgi:hypothetical protein